MEDLQLDEFLDQPAIAGLTPFIRERKDVLRISIENKHQFENFWHALEQDPAPDFAVFY